MKTMGEMICEPQATTIPISLYQLIPSFAATTIREEPKKVYYCQRCLNHNRAEPRKNHKCDCPFAKCSCFKCSLVEKRRRLNLQLHELEGDVEKKDVNDDDEDRSRNKGERVPNCQKCGQHGRKSRLKGHKRVCPYRDCPCAKCLVVTERQKLMADQIKIRRRQRKDTLMNLTREHITSTLNAVNAAAALSAAPAFNFGNLGALFYNTALKTPTAPLLTSPSTSDASYSPSLQFPSPTSLPTILMPPSPESMSPTTSPTVASTPTTASAPLLGPLALNPATFTFPLLSQPQSQPSVVSPENAVLIQTLLAQYRLLESSNLQNAEQQQQNDCANMLIDVCGV